MIRGLGAYAVDRQRQRDGRGQALAGGLAGGGAIGIFPGGDAQPRRDSGAQTGVALLASLGNAPVVPAYIRGTDKALRLGKIDVAFGAPLALAPGRKATREDLSKFTAQIMNAIETLAESIGGNS
jgi:1-acyl-sn-glycerol-3-phosphate acyltransferase